MPIPALIAAGATLAGGYLSNMAAQKAQSRSIAAQRSLQNMLMTGGAQMARNAKQAGLSPAFSLGQSSTPSASSPASNYANFDFSSMQNLLGGINLRKLQREQERTQKAETQEKIANAHIAENESEKSDLELKVLKNKLRTFEPTISDLDEDGFPVVSANKEITGSYGEFLGNLEKQKMEYENNTYKLRILQNDWESKVYRGRNLRDDILNAVVEMPKLERDELIERINNFREDVNLKRTQEALNQCMSIYYMLSGSLASAQTGLVGSQIENVSQNTADTKASSANELIENFSLKQLGKYLMTNGMDIVKTIGGLRNPTKHIKSDTYNYSEGSHVNHNYNHSN